MSNRKSKVEAGTSATIATKQMLAEGTARIWTTIHSPFTMGGNVNRPVFTIVPVLERKKMQGFEFFSFETPKGSIRICECQTGGIIADSFDELKENIKGCTKKELQSQIDGAKSLAEQAKEMSNDEFFSYYRY